MAVEPMPSTRERSWPLAVAATTAVFAAVYGWLAIERLQRFAVTAWDFAIFDQGLWLLSRFQEPFVTVRGLHLFADHSSYLLVLLTPLYWVWPSPAALTLVTVTALAAGIPLSYALGRALGASQALAAVVAGCYLLHPAVSWNVWEGFHPELLVVPLLLGAVLGIVRHRPTWGLALTVLALLAKEDVGLLVVPLGLYVAFALGRRRSGLVMAGAGVVAFAVNMAVILPILSPTGAPIYADRYARFGDGVLSVAWGVVTHPGVALAEIFSGDAVLYGVALVLAMPLAVLAPWSLLVAAPAFLANALSSSPYQVDITYHYTVYLFTALAIGAASGAARLSEASTSVRRRIGTAALALSLGFGLAVGAGPVTRWRIWLDDDSQRSGLEAAVATVPDGAPISAWESTVAHLAHRATVYVFPVPWRSTGYGDLETAPPDPDTVDWVLVRTDEHAEMQDEVSALLAADAYEVVYRQGPVVLLRRIG